MEPQPSYSIFLVKYHNYHMTMRLSVSPNFHIRVRRRSLEAPPNFLHLRTTYTGFWLNNYRKYFFKNQTEVGELKPTCRHIHVNTLERSQFGGGHRDNVPVNAKSSECSTRQKTPSNELRFVPFL